MHRLNSVTFGWLLCVAMAASADDGELLRSRLDKLQSLSGSFEQVTVNADSRVVQENTGQLWVRSPASFRVETTMPFVQTLVSDGTSFWTFDEDLAQVIIRDLEQNVAQVPILLFSGSADAVIDAYRVTRYEDADGEKFVLAPIDDGALFESMTLAFAEEGTPASILIRDSLGQQTRINIIQPSINEPLAEDRFVLEIPDGVDVVDDRTPS